jgi:hypothetical protein
MVPKAAVYRSAEYRLQNMFIAQTKIFFPEARLLQKFVLSLKIKRRLSYSQIDGHNPVTIVALQADIFGKFDKITIKSHYAYGDLFYWVFA